MMTAGELSSRVRRTIWVGRRLGYQYRPIRAQEVDVCSVGLWSRLLLDVGDFVLVVHDFSAKLKVSGRQSQGAALSPFMLFFSR